jgi:hypothetical protein
MNTNRIFALGTVVAIAAIVGLGWFVGLSPLLASAALADQERLMVEQTNQAQQATLASMKSDFERLDEIVADLDALRVAIPSEVDSDVIYAYLARIQDGVPVRVETIITGEAVPYGVSADAPDAVPGEAGTTAGVAQFEGLYTIPVTITFPRGTDAADIITLVGAMQNGPRIFLVTAITRPASSDGSAGTVTAYMFVMAERDDTPGSSAGDHDPSLDRYIRGAIARWGSQGEPGSDAPTPAPTPEQTGESTPAPTPTP